MNELTDRYHLRRKDSILLGRTGANALFWESRDLIDRKRPLTTGGSGSTPAVGASDELAGARVVLRGGAGAAEI
jgi:hypothetical protein